MGIHVLLTPPAVCPFVTLSPPKPLGGILPKLATLLPLMLRVYKSSINFLCVRPCIRRQSICLARNLLLNHFAVFNQTFYITTLMIRVRESNIFSVRPSSDDLSVTQSPSKPLGGIQPNFLYHFPSL